MPVGFIHVSEQSLPLQAPFTQVYSLGLCKTIVSGHACGLLFDIFGKPAAEVSHLLRGIAHVDGALLVAFELGFHAVHGTEGRWW